MEKKNDLNESSFVEIVSFSTAIVDYLVQSAKATRLELESPKLSAAFRSDPGSSIHIEAKREEFTSALENLASLASSKTY